MRSRATALSLVFLGGALGVLCREMLTVLFGGPQQLPLAVFVANVVGALLLGVLLETLHGRSSRAATRYKLLLGTGLLGGFTTYSALAQVVTMLLIDGAAMFAVLYAFATVLVGGIATWFGVFVATRISGAQEGLPDAR